MAWLSWPSGPEAHSQVRSGSATERKSAATRPGGVAVAGVMNIRGSEQLFDKGLVPEPAQHILDFLIGTLFHQ